MLARLIISFVLLVFSLEALSSKEMLQRAEKNIQSSSASNKFRAYDDYKKLYLRSIMEDDSTLKKQSLQGIVNSGEMLHIDVKEYAKELAKIKSQKVFIPPTKQPFVKVKDPKEKQKNYYNLNELEDVKLNESTLVLTFSKKLGKKDLNYFKLYDNVKQQYRYVFDIHAFMDDKSKKLKRTGVKRIRLGQYKAKILRVVMENSKKIKFKFKKKNNKLIITFLDKEQKLVTLDSKAKKRALIIPKNKIIVIDPGHGGKDPGAIGHKKYKEKKVVYEISKELKKILKSRGYRVYMTRDKDKFVKLSKRTQFANKKNADLFISIHANAVDKKIANKAHGVECYFLSKSRTDRAKRVAAKENSADLSDMNIYGKESFLKILNNHNVIASNKLAIDLQRGMLGELKKRYKVHDGGVREGPFWVLVGAQMPSVLVEVGFITHPKEASRLVDNSYQKDMARGLANGIERYFANCY